jgi:hypothetical protein
MTCGLSEPVSRRLRCHIRLPLLVIVSSLSLLAANCHVPQEVRHNASLASAGVLKGVPFVRTLPLSSTPPGVRFQMEGVSGALLTLRGLLYSSDWVTSHGKSNQSPSVPVPWPPAVQVHTPVRSATMVLETGAFPDEVELQAYDRIDTESAEPTSSPKAVFQCHRFTPPNCSFGGSGANVSTSSINSDLLGLPYLVVFMIWGIPPDQRREASSVASASWLFRVEAVS